MQHPEDVYAARVLGRIFSGRINVTGKHDPREIREKLLAVSTDVTAASATSSHNRVELTLLALVCAEREREK